MLTRCKNLIRWWKFHDGAASIYHALKLRRAGRFGGEALLDRARPLRARGNPLTLWARPGTDDAIVFTELFDAGEYRSACTFLQPPLRRIVDLGANVGYSIAWFSALFPQAEFIGVEPSANNIAMARRTLAPLIGSGRVRLHHGFVGGRKRQASIGRGGVGGSNELFLDDKPLANPADAVEVHTLPDLLQFHGWDSIDLLKCDIEGGEAELLEECRPWISRVRQIVIELHTPLDDQWLKQTLAKNGWPVGKFLLEQRHDGAALAWLARGDHMELPATSR